MVTDERVVNAAVEAAESVVFSRYDRSDLRDIDIAVTFEDGTLDADVYLDVPDDDAGAVAEEAALAARETVDDLLEDRY